jgi:hypothetical protein
MDRKTGLCLELKHDGDMSSDVIPVYVKRCRVTEQLCVSCDVRCCMWRYKNLNAFAY